MTGETSPEQFLGHRSGERMGLTGDGLTEVALASATQPGAGLGDSALRVSATADPMDLA